MKFRLKSSSEKSSNFVSSNYALLDMSLLTYGNKHDATLIEQAIEKEFKQINPGC